MKVLGLAASSRRNGNSEILLDRVLAGASAAGAETEKLIISDLDIRFCKGENICWRKGRCHIKDDMPWIYKKLKEADAFVVASPIYFGSISAQLKTLIDRCQPIWLQNISLKKKRVAPKKKAILILVSAGNNKRFFNNAEEISKIFFAVIRAGLFRKIYVPGLELSRAVLKKKDILNKAFRYGADLVKTEVSGTSKTEASDT